MTSDPAPSASGRPVLATSPAVLRALLAGEQIIDLRPVSRADRPPGSDGDGGVIRWWLVASDARPSLKAAYAQAGRLSEFPPPSGVHGWVTLVGRGPVILDAAGRDALRTRTVLDLDALAGERVDVLALRVRRLVEPAADLADIPEDPSDGPASEPALSDVAFEGRFRGLAEALGWKS